MRDGGEQKLQKIIWRRGYRGHKNTFSYSYVEFGTNYTLGLLCSESSNSIVIRCLSSKSRASHHRKEAVMNEWLEEDIRNPRPKNGASNGSSSSGRTRQVMGRTNENDRLNEFLLGRPASPRQRPNGFATITSPRSISQQPASEAQSCSETSPESMNAMFFPLSARPRENGARAC